MLQIKQFIFFTYIFTHTYTYVVSQCILALLLYMFLKNRKCIDLWFYINKYLEIMRISQVTLSHFVLLQNYMCIKTVFWPNPVCPHPNNCSCNAHQALLPTSCAILLKSPWLHLVLYLCVGFKITYLLRHR